ncbi:MAG: hypothetical protein Q9219_003500 [cf. Caloplaca sp. 3 TL-2023]
MLQSQHNNVIEHARPCRLAAFQAPRLQGYPSFADFIAADADAAIYRKYERLSARNLLYQQSELHELEEKLQKLDAEDHKERDTGNAESQRRARFWSHYKRADNERAKEHRELQAEIKAKLKEYPSPDAVADEALILESRILRLNVPSPRVLKNFKRWFRSSVPILWGRDEDLFEDERDMVALAPVETDRLNIFLQSYLGWFLKVSMNGFLRKGDRTEIRSDQERLTRMN